MSPDDASLVLTKILTLEREKQFSDSAVTGGMDAYLARVLSGRRPDFPEDVGTALREPKRVPGGYAGWDVGRRRRWVETTLGLLQGEQVAPPVPGPTHEQTELCLRRPVTSLGGVKDRNAEHLSRLGVRTLGDFLYLLPHRYLDYTHVHRVADLQPGLDQTVLGTVAASRITLSGKRQSTEAYVQDGSGTVRAMWFNQPWIAKRLQPGQRIVVSGPVGVYRGQVQFESPEWERIETAGVHTGRLVPVYPLTKGLYGRRMREWMNRALGLCLPSIVEYLPADIVERRGLPDLRRALKQAHFPDDMTEAGRARQRLAFDELLALQLGLLMSRHEWQEKQPGIPFGKGAVYLERYVARLPFDLTGAQAAALAEIRADLEKPVAMSRMLQGDVGSGKTVVALAALVLAVANGRQGAMMAPTEVLAEQHFRTIIALLAGPGDKADTLLSASSAEKRGNPVVKLSGIEGLPVTVALLMGSLSPAARKEVHAGLESGAIDIVVGTQALVQKSVEFHRLGLAVVDEQHRFGVLQRGELRQKGYNPHVLVMTATPIPRSLALAVYGDLDLTTIDSLPKGRKAISTHVAAETGLDKIYAFIRGQVGEGRQCYIVCPLISESAVLQVRAATDEYRFLSEQVFPDLRVGLLHGSLGTRQKDEVMRAFRDGRIDVLVCTTVVEVGVDVANATVMVILGADRFGLSQLHQLRGRVGRGSEKSYCIVVADSPSAEARERLRALRDEPNGFRLASRDLELRGPGDFLGTQQSGLPQLRVATLTDLSTLEIAREEAVRLMQERDFLSAPLYAPLRQRVERLWNRDVEWS
jgi:ATP-dependent DNA helicase RecG